MNDLALLLVIGLPPAAIVFLALVWAKRWLRVGLAAAVFLVPLVILAWLLATPGTGGDGFARLGILALAIILLGAALVGALLGGIVIGLRYLKGRKQGS